MSGNRLINDHTGKTIGKWYVIEYAGKQRYKCKCIVCGNEDYVVTQHLNQGRDRRCYKCNPVKEISKKTYAKYHKNRDIEPEDINTDLTSFEEIAEEIGVSEERARQIYKRAIQKIQEALKDKDNKNTLRSYLNDMEASICDSLF